jgi:cysteine desulfurase/selenocysteine lyase
MAIQGSIEPRVFDVSRIREDFPILNRRIHDKPLVYLDNAASSQKPRSVIEAVDGFYKVFNSNVHRGVHALSQKATEEFESGRDKVQGFIGAEDRTEIIFVRGTTEAINLVAHSYGSASVGPGDEIIVSEMEHHSNIVPWQILCKNRGATLKVIPMRDNGALDLDAYEDLLNEKTRLVALGTVNPLREIIDAAHRLDVPVLVDGAQAVPHRTVNVRELGCDFYCFSSHKMFGPTGIGVLYGRAELLNKMPPYQSGGDMIRSVSFERTTFNVLPYKFEAGTPNIGGVVGLGAAIDYLQSLDFEEVQAYETSLLGYATEALSAVSGLTLIGTAPRKASVLSFVLDSIHPHDIGTILDEEGVCVRTGHHCAQPVMDHFGLAATTRASLAFYNTTEEIDALIRSIGKAKEVFH